MGAIVSERKAKIGEMTRRIGFSLGGDTIPLSTFIDAAQNLIGLLREVESAISGRQQLVWYISELRMGSTTVEIMPSLISDDAVDQSPAVISATLMGMAKIEREPDRPEFFTDAALARAKDIAGVLNGHVSKVLVFGSSEAVKPKQVRITQRVAANVDQLVGGTTTVWGGVEGTLETISIHGGSIFNVYDTINSQRVRCICSREMIDELAPHIGKRMMVCGEVRENAHGQAISVRVDSYRVLKARQELPQLDDIRGLLADNPINVEQLSHYLHEGDDALD